MKFMPIVGVAAVTVGLCLSSTSPVMAAGMFGGSTVLNPKYCRTKNLRQTVVYIDDSSIAQGQTGWVSSLYNKLKGSLVPGEKLTLVQLSPLSGQSEEIWSGCWPNVDEAQMMALSHQTSFFSGSPLSELKEQQGFFFRDFGIAATKVQKKARPAADVTIDPASPPQKSVLRALLSDGARYANAHETVRVIMYSDLAENSDLGNAFKVVATPIDYGAQLGTYLRHSVIYAFGVARDMHGNGAVQTNIVAFWRNAFESVAANVAALGSDLTIPNSVPVARHEYNITLQDSGQELPGKLSLLTDHDGNLVDSWVGITRLKTSMLNGTLHCAPEGESCNLDAQTTSGIVTTSHSENLLLKSDTAGAMIGTLGVPGSQVNLTISAIPDHI